MVAGEKILLPSVYRLLAFRTSGFRQLQLNLMGALLTGADSISILKRQHSSNKSNND